MSKYEAELEKYNWDYKKEIRKKITSGKLLLSQPFMKDFIFKRTVCLLCAHHVKEGSFGFILNKPTEFKVADLVDSLSAIDHTVYYGGPVNNDALYFLHDNSLDLEGAVELNNGIFYGGDYESLLIKLPTNLNAQQRIKFFIGYSGWDKGQLRKEIIENSWIIGQCKAPYIYNENENLWKTIMEDMGELYQHLANLPESPELN